MSSVYYRHFILLAVELQCVWFDSDQRENICPEDRDSIEEMIRRLIIKTVEGFFPLNPEGEHQFHQQVSMIRHYMNRARIVEHDFLIDEI